MAHFIIFISGRQSSGRGESTEQTEQGLQKYRAWADILKLRGQLVSAEKLVDSTRWKLARRDGQIVVEQSPADKETIGGFFVIEAADTRQALEIAGNCPIFAEGGSLELRQIEGT
jgi:hypothetical protein